MVEAEQQKIAKIPQNLTVKRFAEVLDLPVADVIRELLNDGIVASINESIDFETASIVAGDLGYKVEEDTSADGLEMDFEKLAKILEEERKSAEFLKKRPPVVTILGHVDHGKTTLLDTIRKTNVVSQEFGGITQKISAYQVKHKGELITFVDTPGHEAFSAMRERGASLADIAVLIVAADDGVKPQTKEVMKNLLEKKVPTVVAINKIDKPEANLQKVKQELADNGILIEEWGGKFVHSEISAKANTNINDLLDNILLVAEVEDVKANWNRDALGIILDSKLDPKRGPLTIALVKTGTLKKGQDIIAGKTFGKVRKMENYRNQEVETAPPGAPILVMGLNDLPQAGDILQAVSDINLLKKYRPATVKTTTKKISDEKIKKLNVVLKTDVRGSLEAIHQILDAIQSEEVATNYISEGVGSITESDVKIAQASKAVIFGFSTEPTSVAKRLAETSEVEIKTYKVIYELIEEIKKRLSEMLAPEIIRADLGKMKVVAIFKTGKHDMIVGGKVTEGKLKNGCLIEVKRESNIIGKGALSNLQQNKVDTDEVTSGNECGITFDGETKIKEGDQLVCYLEEVKKKTI